MPDAPFVVIGSGIAGLRAAVELARGGATGAVVVVTKGGLDDSATAYAQGGIAAALSEDDSVALHEEDTLRAGDGLCNREAVRLLVREAPRAIEELLAWGAVFDARETGSAPASLAGLALTREAAHSRSRILHARGDSTGREIAVTLLRHARSNPAIEFHANSMAVGLVAASGRIDAVACRDSRGVCELIPARAVLLATGGLGQVYADTTNPAVATGDGIALAAAAGAWLADMEFVQFHPTALAFAGAPRFLLSEALRGEGAYVRNTHGERFLADYDSRAELAPRDVVARALEMESRRLAGSLPSRQWPGCYLDATHIDRRLLERRFPRICATLGAYGLDLASQWIPIRPAAHYAMGGVWTDLDGRTSLPGLFAAGEAAATGVHGANRLASNSLLEGLVFGARAARAMLGEVALPQAEPGATRSPTAVGGRDVSVRSAIQAGMSRAAGVLRDGADLRHWLGELRESGRGLAPARSLAEVETAHLAAVAEAITLAALAREESRGAHFRADFPAHREEWAQAHSWQRGGVVRLAPSPFGADVRSGG